MNHESKLPRILVVAGSDSSGGAGLDADREAIVAAGGECIALATAATRQSGGVVHSIQPRDPDAWYQEALDSAQGIECMKIGLLPGREHVQRARDLVDALRGSRPGLPVVLDPVLAASGGEVFLDEAGREALIEALIPLGVIVTPNLGEAALLSGHEVARLASDPEARVEAADVLLGMGASGVVLKGGHASGDQVRDLVLTPGEAPVWVENSRIPGPGMHGSGCRHASTLATCLARGESLFAAASAAAAYLVGRIQDTHRS